MKTRDEMKWATALVSRMVLHAPTGLVGRCIGLREPGEYVSSVTGEKVPAWVLELDEGSGLVAEEEEAFVPLDDKEARFYVVVVSALATSMAEAGRLGASLLDKEGVGLRLIQSALEAQLRALKVGPGVEPGEAMP